MSEVVTQLRIPSETTDGVSGVVVGVVEGESSDGWPLVRWGRGRRDACQARAVWMETPLKWSTCKGLRAVLGFEDGDENKPIVLGLLDRPSKVAELSTDAFAGSEPASDVKPKVLRIESEQELILECGKAKIALRADGRVVILGGYVLSRSKGVNKIKGGSVQIN